MALGKRMMVRLGGEDEAWVAEQAADEGVEAATWVRMVINRLRRGRPALLSMLQAQTVAAPRMNGKPQAAAPQSILEDLKFVEENPNDLADPQEAADVLAQRLQELEQTPIQAAPPAVEAAAVSLQRMPRNKFNPGRQ